jgi:hypothetical protein
MVRKKTEPTKFTFLETAQSKKETRTVAARVDSDLITSFERAVILADKHGMTLSITSVIQKAIEQAIHEVEQLTGSDVNQMDIE